MKTFTGVLAVLDAPTTDSRVLASPTESFQLDHLAAESHLFFQGDEENPTAPMPSKPPPTCHVGTVARLWVEGNVLRYSGTLDDETYPAIARAIENGELVGHLDVAEHHYGTREPVGALDVLRTWRVNAVWLGPADSKAWPEVSLTVDPADEPSRV